MKTTRPVYEFNKGNLVIHYETETSWKTALDIGAAWLDSRYGFLKAIVSRHDAIITCTDLIACDDYIECLRSSQVVVFYVDKDEKGSASRKRLETAYNKLISQGYLCRFFASKKAALNYISKLETPSDIERLSQPQICKLFKVRFES